MPLNLMVGCNFVVACTLKLGSRSQYIVLLNAVHIITVTMGVNSGKRITELGSSKAQANQVEVFIFELIRGKGEKLYS